MTEHQCVGGRNPHTCWCDRGSNHSEAAHLADLRTSDMDTLPDADTVEYLPLSANFPQWNDSGCTEHCYDGGHLHFELDGDGNRLEDPNTTSAMIRDGGRRPNPEAMCHRCGYAMLDEPKAELTRHGWQHPGCPWIY